MNGFSAARWWSIVMKEFLQLRRDRLTFAMMIGIPIAQLLLFGYAINADPKNLPTAVIAADYSEFTRSFLTGLGNTGYFRLVGTLPDERAAAGLFLAFQYPLEIPGVATMTFLRTALNAQRKKRGEAELSTPEFLKTVRDVAKKLGIDLEMLRRAVNVGFSGGEKKRNEILQMALLEPRLAVLDETDSGLDIDALKIVAEGVNRLRSPQRAFVVITHYQRLLNYIVPDVVHVLSRGRIMKTGGKELALDLEARGYAEYQEEAAA